MPNPVTLTSVSVRPEVIPGPISPEGLQRGPDDFALNIEMRIHGEPSTLEQIISGPFGPDFIGRLAIALGVSSSEPLPPDDERLRPGRERIYGA